MKTKRRPVRTHDHTKPTKIKWYQTELFEIVYLFFGFLLMFGYGYYVCKALNPSTAEIKSYRNQSHVYPMNYTSLPDTIWVGVDTIDYEYPIRRKSEN